MKRTSLLSILLTIFLLPSCKNSPAPKETVNKPDSLDVHNIKVGNIKKVTASHSQTHLNDTITLNENFILFLMPDSARFASLEDEPGIYDADSDFGDGVTNTIDSFSKNERYKNIKIHTTEKRFINITDCNSCPVTIDRDSVNFGIILSSKGRKPETKYNEVHSGNYIQELKEYFGL